MSEITDAQRLMARGTDMELANGSTHTVWFSNRSLARIEDDYGTLQDFTKVLQAKPFRTVAYVIALTLGVPMDQTLDMVVTKKVKDYVTAIATALEEALPEQTDQGNLTAAPDASPGAAFSTSPSSPGTSTPSASGT